MRKLLLLLALLLALPLMAAEDKPVIILKFDDMVTRDFRGGKLHSNWQTVLDLLRANGIRKCSIGIINDSLEQDDPAFCQWVKDQQAKGEIEFWCHGYKGARQKMANGELEPGEFEGDYASQKAALEKAQALAEKRFGFRYRSFGPHWSGTTADTARALQETGFTSWMYADPKDGEIFKGHIYPRHLGLEHQTFLPNAEEFKKRFARLKGNKDVLVLQGHPKAWFYNNKKDEPADARYQQFKLIIEFLAAEGCVFETPSGYLEYMKKNPPRHTPKKVNVPLFKQDFSKFAPGDAVPAEWKGHGKISFRKDGDKTVLSLDGNGGVAWSVPLQPGQSVLEFSGRLRVKDVVKGKAGWQDARVAMNFLDANGKRMNVWPPVLNAAGTADWKTATFTFEAPEGARTLQITPAHFGTSGVADFADVSVRCIGVLPR